MGIIGYILKDLAKTTVIGLTSKTIKEVEKKVETNNKNSFDRFLAQQKKSNKCVQFWIEEKPLSKYSLSINPRHEFEIYSLDNESCYKAKTGKDNWLQKITLKDKRGNVVGMIRERLFEESNALYRQTEFEIDYDGNTDLAKYHIKGIIGTIQLRDIRWTILLDLWNTSRVVDVNGKTVVEIRKTIGPRRYIKVYDTSNVTLAILTVLLGKAFRISDQRHNDNLSRIGL